MYDLGPQFERVTVDAGTNILVTGPPLTGKRRVVFEILARGVTSGEGAVVVTTRDSSDRVLESIGSLTPDVGSSNVGVVDCVTQHLGQSVSDTDSVSYASSPEDMTGIGIGFSELLKEFRDRRDLQQNRIALDSLTTLLFYSDPQTVFQFVHVVTSRVKDVGALGVHTIESTAHDAETVNTIRQLFDGVIEFDESGKLSTRLPDADATVAER
jgi:RecA-superfamily ATPases implicated in signal transduction